LSLELPLDILDNFGCVIQGSVANDLVIVLVRGPRWDSVRVSGRNIVSVKLGGQAKLLFQIVMLRFGISHEEFAYRVTKR